MAKRVTMVPVPVVTALPIRHAIARTLTAPRLCTAITRMLMETLTGRLELRTRSPHRFISQTHRRGGHRRWRSQQLVPISRELQVAVDMPDSFPPKIAILT